MIPKSPKFFPFPRQSIEQIPKSNLRVSVNFDAQETAVDCLPNYLPN